MAITPLMTCHSSIKQPNFEWNVTSASVLIFWVVQASIYTQENVKESLIFASKILYMYSELDKGEVDNNQSKMQLRKDLIFMRCHSAYVVVGTKPIRF